MVRIVEQEFGAIAAHAAGPGDAAAKAGLLEPAEWLAGILDPLRGDEEFEVLADGEAAAAFDHHAEIGAMGACCDTRSESCEKNFA